MALELPMLHYAAFLKCLFVLPGLFLALACDSEVSEATRQLQDENAKVREQGARRLAESSRDISKSLPQLIRSLADDNQDVRRLAANALGDLGPKAKDAVPALVKLLEDSEENVRLVAAWALVNIDPENEAPVDVLSQSAREGNPRSIVALGQLGPAAAEAVPALIRALQSEKSLVRLQVLKALEKIGPQPKPPCPP